MSLLAYSLSAVVAFLGLFVGAFLARATKEEMPTATRYFPWLQKILFLIMVAVFFQHFKVSIIIRFVIYAVLLFSLLRKETINFYIVLAVFFFMLGQANQSMFTVATLIFLYGFPTGSLLVAKGKKLSRQKVIKKILKQYGLFLIISIGLQVLYSIFVLKSFS